MHRRVTLLALTLALTLPIFSIAAVSAEPITHEQFNRVWSRTDYPVSSQQVDRTWIWGPGPFTEAFDEPYAEAPGGERLVQYFDKSRMEDNSYRATQPWDVTNGLLVVEMVTGIMQLGDNNFVFGEASTANVAGDQGDFESSPTYQTIAHLIGLPPRPLDEAIIEEVNRAGEVTENATWGNIGIRNALIVDETQHGVAEVFWEFMTSSAPVHVDGQLVTQSLFENPFFATGYPITEAYWTEIPVAGEMTEVLFQCFERRCLTFTPSNEPGWHVEAGNVGRHYYEWRYGQNPISTVYLVALGDNGQSGDLIGCEDSIIPVQIPVDSHGDTIVQTIQELVATESPFGESGLYNALTMAQIEVESVVIDENSLATVHLTGQIPVAGVCDIPRVVEQLERTVLAVPEVEDVEIYLNGAPLAEALAA